MPRATSLQAKFRALSKKKLKRLRRNQPQPKQQGASLKSINKKKLRQQYNDFCMLCNHFEGDAITVHHLVFKCQGGGDEYSNLVLVCETCAKKIHKLPLDSKELKEITKKLIERKKWG